MFNESTSPKVPVRTKILPVPVVPFVISLFLFGCAGQIQPPGGPRDTTPPAIIATVPDSNSTHIKDNAVTLEFSEYVDRSSVEESIFISPYVGKLEFDWGTTDVRIQFGEELKPNRTYVVNVGTDVKDRREHNRMAQGYTLAFSTGDSIDHGFISGRVVDEKPEGVMIFAYLLDAYNPDTLNPAHVRPDYIMQSGKDGRFQLSNLAMGKYRVLAVRDEFKNFLYEKESDQFGVPTGDVILTPDSSRVAGLQYRLTREDTTKPFLTSATAVAQNHVQLRFSEPIDSIAIADARFTISDTLGTKLIPLLLASPRAGYPTTVDLIAHTTLDSGATYRATARGVLDRVGNPLDTTHATGDFAVTTEPDTIKPHPSVLGVSDSARGIPLDRGFTISFGKPVLHPPVEAAVVFQDTGRVTIPGSLRWIDAADLLLQPREPLKSNTLYRIRMPLDSLRDYSGNIWKDSIWTLRFRTVDLRSTGSVEGVVIDNKEATAKGKIVLTVSGVDVNPPIARTITMEKPGAFTVEQLPEGRYTFSGFRDADSSGTYTYGSVFPFAPSERFAVSQDTVKVRARWSVEGARLIFE